MKRAWILFTLLALTLRPGSVQALGLIPPKGVGVQPERFSPNLTAYDVIAEVNSLRAANDLPPYQVNSILMTIAQAHAEYMGRSGVITHFGEDGSRPHQRAMAAGYSVAGDLSLGGFLSENIDAGADLSPSEVVVKWQGDSLHLNTMISPDLKDIGAGVVVVDGMTYYVLDAGASTGEPLNTPSSPAVIFTSTLGTQSAPVVASTPLEDGTVYHVVRPNEALWSIALAYHLTVEELKKLNRLSSDDIYIGQKLLISKLELNTSTLEPTITVTLGIPTSTATRPVTPTVTFTSTPLPTAPQSRQNGGIIVGGIIIVALLAAGLGAWLGQKEPT